MKKTLNGKRRVWVISVVLVAITVSILLTVIFFTARKDALYHSMDDGKGCLLWLGKNGTFGFVQNIDGRMKIFNERDTYHWSEGMLILEFADTDRTWFFRKDEDRLIFQEDLSSMLESDTLKDGMVFIKISDG